MGSKALKVSDVMSASVLTVRRNDTLSVPDQLMRQERVRHIPVLDDNGDLCGITTQRDLFRGALLKALGYGSRAEEMLLSTVLVKDVMSEDLITTSPGATLGEAASRMLEAKVGCLPVLDGEKLVGILTESDFVKLHLS